MYDLSNNFGAVFTIGENNGTNMLGRDKEGMGVHSRVGTRVVCDRDAVVDDDLPTETHPGRNVAGSARFLVGADPLTCILRGPVAGHNQALGSNCRAEAVVAHHAGNETRVVGNGRFDQIGSVPGGSQRRRKEDTIAV